VYLATFSNAMIQGAEISKIVLPRHADLIFKRQPQGLWGIGNAEILRCPLLAIISAREFNSNLGAMSMQLIQELATSNNAGFISGWHSRLEQDCLRILLAERASLVFCLSKALDRFKPSAELEQLVAQKKALLLTHCTPRAKRISREASIRRNELVIGLAAALLVLSAPEGSTSLNLARAALDGQKPVFTFEHHINRTLLDCGAAVATFNAICTAVHETSE
jgi:predicted Rossmann fold nucleotide-binding protein DprA/Smf involved in DNA uptake